MGDTSHHEHGINPMEMNYSNPRTSFVIRTFNEQLWLGNVLNALFTQSLLDFEVIIVDSGSTDSTLQIISCFPVRKVIKIKHNEFNYAYALNLGIQESKADFTGILSGHSLPTSRTWYSDGLKNFENKSVAGVTGYYSSLPDGSYEEKLFDISRGDEITKKTHYYPWMTNTNSIIRRKLWLEYPFNEMVTMGSKEYNFAKEGCEDIDWAIEMISRGWDIIADPLFNVFHSHGGLNRPIFSERKDQWEKINKISINKKRPSYSWSKLYNGYKKARPTLHYPRYFLKKLLDE